MEERQGGEGVKDGGKRGERKQREGREKGELAERSRKLLSFSTVSSLKSFKSETQELYGIVECNVYMSEKERLGQAKGSERRTKDGHASLLSFSFSSSTTSLSTHDEKTCISFYTLTLNS